MNDRIPRGVRSRHDQVRADRAAAADWNDLESLHEAVIGLQSTDDPDLVPLHDQLAARLRELTAEQGRCLTREIGGVMKRSFEMENGKASSGATFGTTLRPGSGAKRKPNQQERTQ